MLMEYRGEGRWPDTYRGLRQTQEEVNRLLGQLHLAPQTEFPAINIWTGGEGAILTAEAPGVAPEQIDISVHEDTVTLRGKREPERIEGDVAVERRERAFGDFARTVKLPFRIDAGQVAARFERGILVLSLPRPATDKPRRIKVERS